MSSIPHRTALIVGLAGAIVLALAAWVIGSQIRSPAQVAADTAAPDDSLITVPVERRTLATEVIVRGTVRYGAPRPVALASSTLKTGGDIVTQPPRRGARLSEGALAMSMSGRPVFVLQGAQPMHRDIGSGASGPDVRQLEQGLARAGFAPGAVDGTYDSATAVAVSAWYRKKGWTPFGATDAQSEQLRVAQANVATARDANLQARMALAIAQRGATAAEVNQARLDAVAAAEAVAAADLDVATARTRTGTTRDAAARAAAAVALGTTTNARDVATARADLATKLAALNSATAAQAEAQKRTEALGPETRAAELQALRDAVTRAIQEVELARQGADAATANLTATQAALAEAQAGGTPAAISRAEADVALAQSELAGKQSAFTAAESARAEAQRRVDQPPPDTRSVEVQSAQSALSQATGNIAAANEDIVASRSALVAAEASARSAVAQVRTDARAARRDVTQARAELRRATRARANAARLAGLAQARVTILSSPDDTALQNEIVAATQLDLARVNAEANRVAAKAAIQVPADELLFFPTLPLRVDSVRLKRGDTGAGRAMTVSNSELAADSSLSINDAKLVRLGAPVVIEEQDLRITVQGRVSRIADRPGTDRVDPTRVYFEVTPSQAPAKLVGASVRLTIKVESTKGKVLAVPLSAVTVGADGRPRVQVDRGSRSEYVPVVPGLAANGLVEVRPSRAGALEVGDLVVVGVKGSISPGALPGGTTAPGAGGTTPPTPGTGTAPASGTAPSAVTAPVTGTAPSTTTPAP